MEGRINKVKVAEINTKKVTLKCSVCNKYFERYKSKGGKLPKKPCCSRECRDKTYVRKIQVKCSYCGESIKRSQKEVRMFKKFFCDKECKAEGQKKELGTYKCNNCGNEFKRKKSEVRHSNKFCSTKCDYENRLDMKATTDEVFMLIASGLTVRQVSDVSGVSYTTLNKILAHRDYKVKRRIKRSRNKKVDKQKREVTPVQNVNEMDVMGRFGLKPEWRLPIGFCSDEEFNKWEYFELVGISPKFTEMKKIYYANITYSTTENKRNVTKSSKEVCVGETLDEVLSYEQGLKTLKHSIGKKCKNDFNIISVEPISYLGDVNSSVSKNRLK